MRLPDQCLRKRDPRAYLLDMLRAMDLLWEAAGNRTLDDYLCDAVLRSAVERQFITIGEALTQLLRQFPELHTRISNTRQIIAFRNIMVHGYASISHDVVWAALQGDVPILRHEVDALLRDPPGPELQRLPPSLATD